MHSTSCFRQASQIVSLEHLIFLDRQNQQDFRNGCLGTLPMAREDGWLSVATRRISDSAKLRLQTGARGKYK